MTHPVLRAPDEGELHLAHGCTAVYKGRTIEVSSHEDEEVVVPLADGAKVASVTAILHTGEEQPHRFSDGDGGVLVFVPASTGPIRCIRIKW